MSQSRRRRGIQVEPPSVTKHIARTLERYPDGGQILKELIQNADDAEAREVKFILDSRQHPTDNLIHERLSRFQGPALFAWNNAVFKEEDWEHFGKMEESSKEKDALKVGRFGVGFLSVFHITDLPMLISTDTAAILDPHKTFTGTDKRGWDDSIDNFLQYRGHAKCFKSLGSCSVLPGTKHYPATLFRFPLRLPGAASEISSNAYPVERVRKFLFNSFIEEAPLILLFLKHVEEISLYDGETLLYKVSIHSSHRKNVRSERDALIQLGLSNPLYPYLRLFSMSICVDNFYKNERKCYNWLIFNMIGSSIRRIQELRTKLEILPWVGVAAPLPEMLDLSNICIDKVDITQLSNVLDMIQRQVKTRIVPLAWCDDGIRGHTDGHAFCFLPLPNTTHLPINIHGYFGVSDNRRTIEWPASDNKSDKAIWNQELVLKHVAPLYSILIGCRSKFIMYKNTPLPAICGIDEQMTDPYAAWPLCSKVRHKEIWSVLVKPTIVGCINSRVFWSAIDDWVSLEEAIFFPEKITFPFPKVAIDILVQAKIPIVKLPKEIRETISECQLENRICTTITPSHVRKAFSRVKVVFNSFDEFQPLLECLLCDITTTTCSELFGLRIVPLQNGNFTLLNSTLINPRKQEFVYFATKALTNVIDFLPGTESRLVNISTTSNSIIYTKLLELAKQKVSQIRLLNPDIICQDLLPQSIQSWSKVNYGRAITWKIKDSNCPSSKWIRSVWNWLDKYPDVLHKTIGLQILPIELINDHTRICKLLPLPCSSNKYYFKNNTDESISSLFDKLGATVIENNPFVANHSKISQYVIDANIPNVIAFLDKNRSAIDLLSESDIEELRVLIAQYYYSYRSIDHQLVNVLRQLSIYELGVGRTATQLISLESRGIILPPSNMAFDVQLQYPPNILNPTETVVHSLLSQKLNFPCSNHDDVYCTILKFAFAQCSGSRSWNNGDELIVWVMKQSCYLSSRVKLVLSEEAFVRTEANLSSLKKPCELYNPIDKEFLKLFDIQDDETFPSNVYKKKGTLDLLFGLGLISWANVKENIVTLGNLLYERASAVKRSSKTKRFQRSCNILELIASVPRYSDELMRQVEMVPFIRIQDTPSDFPSSLPWYGSGKQDILEAPNNLCYQYNDVNLIGCIKPIMSNQYTKTMSFQLPENATMVFFEPTVATVLQQLSILIQCESRIRQSDIEYVSAMIDRIYFFLNKHRSSLKPSFFPKCWIWWSHDRKYKFMPPDNFVLTSPFDLAPFVYCIQSDERFLKYNGLLQKSGIKSKPMVCDLVNVLHRLPTTSLDDRFIKMSIAILNELHENKYSDFHALLLPTADRKLCPAKQCTYDDREWVRKKVGTGFKNLSLLHESIPASLAEYCGVDPLSRKAAPSSKISLQYTRAGQKENLTRRISGIVNDYSGNIDVFKELIQNADDAKATEIKLLMDWRSHGKESLFEEGMKHWQGPALIAYNNATFSDQDFENIGELASETKMSDPLKTGRFGVGFCSCYSLTDVPSFLSRRFLTIFDPHTNYLGDRIDHLQPGMRIDMVAEKEGVKIFEDQLAPFKNLFDLDLHALEGDGFNGTIFRFPLRSTKSPHSSITNERYDYERMSKKINELQKEAQKLLIFLKHIRSLEIYELDKNAKNTKAMKLVFKVSKTCPTSCRMDMIQKYLKRPSISPDPVCSSCKISVTMSSQHTEQNYLMASALNESLSTKQKGMLSLAEIAIKISKDGIPFPQNDGQLFCFLPLPLNHSLPFHINGYFNVGKDRRGLKEAEDSDEFIWNKFIISDVLPRAYEFLLHTLTSQLHLSRLDISKREERLKNYYSLLPRKSEIKGWVTDLFCSAIHDYLPSTKNRLLWSEANGGNWIGVSNTCFYDKSYSLPPEIENSALKLLISEGIRIVKCPDQWFDVFKASVSKEKNTWSYRKFFKEFFIAKISKFENKSRNKHLHFLLKKISEEKGLYSLKYFDWGIDLLKETQCVPIAGSDSLVYPCHLINTREVPISKLYSVCDGRFPDEEFRSDYSTDSLIILGMVSKELPVSDLVERAETVCKINPQDNARERMKDIIQYLMYIEHRESRSIYSSYLSYPNNSDSREVRINALSSVKFLTAQEKPLEFNLLPWCSNVNNTFFSPSELYSSKHAELLFSQKPILATCASDPNARLDNIEMYLGIDNHTPNFEDVLKNLNCLVDHLVTMDPEEWSKEFIDFIDTSFLAMYRFLNTHSHDHEDDIQVMLVNKRCIWQEGRLHYPSQLLFDWNGVSCYPYLDALSVRNKSYKDLFMTLDIEREASYEFLAQVLMELEDSFGSNELTEEHLEFVSSVASKMSKFPDIDKTVEVFLPDSDGILRSSKNLCCDSNLKIDWIKKLPAYHNFKAKGGHFINEKILRIDALKLGAYEIIDAVLKNAEDETFLSGMEFGQREDLVDRLNGILKKYPADESIFKEFIQNADDAKANEIVFVLDHRTDHPDEMLVADTNRWKSLQKKPALCIFNDRPFNEEDIASICKLGRGGKGETDDTIGRFGIGFNVAYHLTDCPMFVSFDGDCRPADFCVFDPLMKYCTKANSKIPGRRWTSNDETHTLQQFSHQFKPFLKEEFGKIKEVARCFNNLTEGFTVFRLPLVHDRSSSYNVPSNQSRFLKEARIDSISELIPLVNKLKCESENMVLFMNNLKSISVFEIQSTGEINHHFSSFKSVRLVNDRTTEIDLCHQIKRGSFSHTSANSRWLMNSYDGFPKTSNLQNMLDAASERGLKPFGNSAIQLDFKCRAHHQRLLFYFLPLKISSCVPVHFNAHFLVDDSRSHLDKLPNLEDWNKTIARHILVPSYLELILKARDYVVGSSESVKWYYSLFPNKNPFVTESEASILNIDVAFYEKLIAENPPIFLDERCLADGDVKWLKINSGNIGHFCTTFNRCQPYINASSEDKKLLLSIGMPITCAPEFVFECLCNASPEYAGSRVGLITPEKVIEHLRTKRLSEKEIEIIKHRCMQLLLFCLQFFKGRDARSYLSGAPILLTLDDTLDASGSLFESNHANLLPNCRNHFIKRSLEFTRCGDKLRDMGAITTLSVDFVSKQLQLEDVDEAKDLDREERFIVERLWSYIEDPIISLNHQPDIVCRHFKNKPIIPTTHDTFYPPSLGKCVYIKSTVNPHISNCIDKLGYPTVNFNLISVNTIPNAVVSVLSDTTNPHDIIRSMELHVPKYDVQFSADEVNRFLSVVSLHPQIPSSVSEMLKHLPLFETVDGSYLSLSKAEKFYILPSTIPRDGLEKVQQCTNKLILNVPGSQMEKFYAAILSESEYSLAKLSNAQFYIQLVLPHFEYFTDDEIFRHLAIVQPWLFHSSFIADNEKDEIIKLLSITRLIDRKYHASDLYDPEIEFHAKFNETKLPPEKWRTWLDLLRLIGLRQQIDYSSWLKRAKSVAERALVESPSELAKKSMALLLSLKEMIKNQAIQNQTNMYSGIDPDFLAFLVDVSKIRFIYNNDHCEVTEKLENILGLKMKTSNRFVLFHDAALNKNRNLAFLCRTILPSSCRFIEHPPYTGFQNSLSIRNLSTKTVGQNLIELSKLLCSQNVQAIIASPEKRVAHDKLKIIFIEHYKYLDENYDDNKVYKLLIEERCILLSDNEFSFHLIKPTQLVLQLPRDLELRPFCYPVPMELLRYDKVLKALGVKPDVDYLVCLDILRRIRTAEVTTKSIGSKDYQSVCQCTYDLLISLLRKNPLTIIPKEKKLYLPSENYELVELKDLTCNDVPWIRTRLQASALKFLCLPSPNEKGQKIPPPCLKVKLLSEIASEEIHQDMFNRLNKCKHQEFFKMGKRNRNCELILALSDTFSSQEFFKGFGRLYWHENEKHPGTDKEFCRRLRAIKSLTLECVDTIMTVVMFNGRELRNTKDDSYMCYLKEDDANNKLILYVKHEQESDEFLVQLATMLNKYLNQCVRNEMLIKAILQCQPEAIEDILDNMRISPFDSSKNRITNDEMSIGSEIEIDSFIRIPEQRVIMCDYDENEKVIYHSIVDGRPSYNIAKITKKYLVDEINLERRLVLCCDVTKSGVPIEKSVSILQVYKLLNEAKRQTLISENSSQYSTPLLIAPLPDKEQDLHAWIEQTINKNENELICDIGDLCERIIIHMHYLFVSRGDNRELFISGAKVLANIVRSIHHGVFQNIIKLVQQLAKSAVANDDIFGDPTLSTRQVYLNNTPPDDSITPCVLTSTTNLSSFSYSNYNTTVPIHHRQPVHHHPPATQHHPPVHNRPAVQQTSRFSNINRIQSTPSYRFSSAARHQPMNFIPFQHEESRIQSKSDVTRAKVWLQQAKADYIAARDIYNHFIKEKAQLVYQENLKQEDVVDDDIESEMDMHSSIEPKMERNEETSTDDFESACADSECMSSSDDDELIPCSTMYPSLENQENDDTEELNETNDTVSSFEEIEMVEDTPKSSESCINSGPSILDMLVIEDILEIDHAAFTECTPKSEQDQLTIEEIPEAALPECTLYSEQGETLQSNHQAVVCFLCHNVVEKCIKGILYSTKTGLSDSVLNCRNLITLSDELKKTANEDCSAELKKEIEECATLIVDYGNKTRYPNYHGYPPRVPATAYTPLEATRALLNISNLLRRVHDHDTIGDLLGELGVLCDDTFKTALTECMNQTQNTECPELWSPHTEEDGVFKLELLDGEITDVDEFEFVASAFESTLSPRMYKIQRIERIQNKHIWQKYLDCANRMNRFNHGNIGEKTLFHGTSFNAPEKIYQGDVGFDMRYSNQGMWGIGNYFAVNSSYCNSGYAHQCTGGLRQIIMASVLTGHVYTCQPNRSLTQPPVWKIVDGITRRFDTVSGVTGGSEVYITYENDRAYPAYLITYK